MELTLEDQGINRRPRIKLFGHSMLRGMHSWAISYKDETPHDSGVETFADILSKRYGIDDGHRRDLATNVTCCSEERILYFIKKYGPQIDLAVILHAPSWFVFNPSFNRDFPLNKPRDIEEIKVNPTGWIRYEGSSSDRFPHSKFDGVREDSTKIVDTIHDYLSSFGSIDLQRNRYLGALIQIDQYLMAKRIHAIHLPWSNSEIPPWFSFGSGPVLHGLQEKAHDPQHWKSSYHASPNAVTPEGNRLIADAIAREIDAWLLSKDSR